MHEQNPGILSGVRANGGDHMKKRITHLWGAGLVVALLASLMAATSARAFSFPHRYTIGGTAYYEISAKTVTSLPFVPPEVRDAVRLLSACPNLSVNIYVRTNFAAGGLTAVAPGSIRACVENLNGGPGSFSPCYAFYKPPSTQDYAAVVGTSDETCADLEFEIPGGVTFVDDGQSEVVKAQGYVNGALVDFFAPSATVPASRNEYRIYDSRLTRPFGRVSSLPLWP
jgi:hypothetical protein